MNGHVPEKKNERKAHKSWNALFVEAGGLVWQDHTIVF